MRTKGAGTGHVVDRCPRCGVEHEGGGVHECEACGAALRSWCRAHSREIGWLDHPACARCAQEAARPSPAPAPRRESPPVHPTPPARPLAAGVRPAPPPAHVLFPGKPARGRSLREILDDRRPSAERFTTGPDEGAPIGGVLLVILGVAVGGLLGVMGGIIYVSSAGGNEEAVVTWALGGMGVGLLAGLGVALAAIAQASRRE